MVHTTIKEQEIYFDGYLLDNLKTAKQIVKDDWDMVFTIDGDEGAGKSVLAQQIAGYFDPDLNMERICFSPNEFKKAIGKAKKYQAVIFDEAMSGLSSRQAMTYVNRTLVSMLAEIRQKNLFVLIVLPCFFELDKYPAIWRSRALIHVYHKGFKRGYFSYYSQKKKKDLYMRGKKFYQYNVKPNFRGRFLKRYIIDEKEYRKKKLKTLSKSEIDPAIDYLEQRDSLIRLCAEAGWKHKKIVYAINKYSSSRLGERAIGMAIKRSKELDTLRIT